MSTKRDRTSKKILNEIFEITTIIQKKHPELYLNLNETPLFLTYKKDDLSLIDLEQYLESLKVQLNTFEKIKT